MNWAWVNAVTVDMTRGSNKRAAPRVASEWVGLLSPVGELVRILDVQPDAGSPALRWRHCEDAAGQRWWVRSDVAEIAFLRPEGLLWAVPWISQNDRQSSLSRNDCGQACSAMLLGALGIRATVDDVTRAMGISDHRYTTLADNMAAVRRWGAMAQVSFTLHLADVLNLVEQGQPVMVLVNYHWLRPGHRYGHYVVVVGYRVVDGRLMVLVHDPNDRPAVAYAAGDLVRGLTNEGIPGNSPWQGMWLAGQVAVSATPAPTVQPIGQRDQPGGQRGSSQT